MNQSYLHHSAASMHVEGEHDRSSTGTSIYNTTMSHNRIGKKRRSWEAAISMEDDYGINRPKLRSIGADKVYDIRIHYYLSQVSLTRVIIYS